MGWISDGHGCVERVPDSSDFGSRTNSWTNPDPKVHERARQIERRQQVARTGSLYGTGIYRETWPHSYNAAHALLTLDMA